MPGEGDQDGGAHLPTRLPIPQKHIYMWNHSHGKLETSRTPMQPMLQERFPRDQVGQGEK